MKTFGLIGNPISHSFSKKFFTEKFKKENINAAYKTFKLDDLSDFQDLLKKTPPLKGLNVTIPFKEKILPFLDDVEKQADLIGAVNTIAFKNGKRIGYNTDCFGFMKSLFPIVEKQHERALILGTGGAAKAVAHALHSLGIEFKMVSRNPDNNQLGYKDLTPELMTDYYLIINCTPLGSYPQVDEAPQLPYEHLTKQHLLYDLTYNPPMTQFLAKGQKQGCQIFNGQKMLEYQAQRSWEIWNER